MANKTKGEFDLEQAIIELEKIVATMESEQTNLEKSLKLFERGIILTKSCYKALTEAEQKIKQLIEKNDKTELEE